MVTHDEGHETVQPGPQRIPALQATVDEFVASLWGRQADSTVSSYQGDLRQLTSYVAGRGVATWAEVTPAILVAWLDTLPPAASTRARKLSSTRSFFRWMLRPDITHGVERPKVRPVALDTGEAAIVAALPSMADTPLRAALVYLLLAGLTPSEVGRLDIRHLQGYDLLVGRRRVQLSTEAVGAVWHNLISAYGPLRPVPPTFALVPNVSARCERNLYPGRLSRQVIWGELKRMMVAAGVEPISPRAIRREALISAHADLSAFGLTEKSVRLRYKTFALSRRHP